MVPERNFDTVENLLFVVPMENEAAG